jgi:hydrogenase maturation protease
MRIAVLGMGNVLMGDDGAGPYAVAVLEARYRLADEVTVLDVGTPGLDLVPYLSGADVLLLVDTVWSDAPPGTLGIYDKQTLLRSKLPPRLSPHDPALGQCLAMLEMEGRAPGEMLLLGIVPETTEFGPGLSAAVQAAIPQVVERICEEIRKRGVGVEARSPAAEADLWWEAKVERV